MAPMIRLKDVSLTYTVYDVAARSLKNRIFNFSVGGEISSDNKGNTQVAALHNVSFEATEGDRIALLGLNGAGKSTLLRVISQVFTPNTGTVEVNGTVSTLFNINLGIDPYASGYDNIVLRGLLMGLSRSEIEGKADEIAEFSELGTFLHMPVRTYSAGMHLRLAFAISTSISPDILLIDEWMATGDIQFFEKANMKLHSLVEDSTVMVMATHNLDHAKELCNKALLMHYGQVLMFDDVEKIVALYTQAETG